METFRPADAHHRVESIEILAASAAAAYFIATRAIALFQPYHQDEYKWTLDVARGFSAWTSIPHPPVAFWTYFLASEAFGLGLLRIVPAVLFAVLAVLTYRYVRATFGWAAACWSAVLFAAIFYALLASVQVDIDGAFLPLIAMLSYLAYLRLRAVSEGSSRLWYALGLALCVVVGFGIKLSYVLVPAALVLDYAFHRPAFIGYLLRPRVMAGVALGAAAFAFGLALVWNQVSFLQNVNHYFAFSGRAYGEMLFETAKALLYVSPLIIVGIAFGWRYRRELSFWYIFLGLNVLFYFVAFDFTHSTLDRYLMFLILPGVVITATAMARMTADLGAGRQLMWWVTGATVFFAALFFLLALLPHALVPLVPKMMFVEALLHGRFSILIPFSGGSGPLGFYAPLDVQLVAWALAFCAAGVAARGRGPLRAGALAILLGVSLAGNILFAEEYLFGGLYGSAPRVERTLTAEIVASSSIPAVITYNDVGAYDLIRAGKYAGRFYPHPEFVSDNIVKFSSGPGFYLVVDMPHLNPDITYGKYFSQCITLASATSGHVQGRVFDCRTQPPASIAGS